MGAKWRRLVLMGLDAAAAVAMVLLAFLVRFALEGAGIPPEPVAAFFESLPFIILSRLLINSVMGLYSQVWRYASVRELMRIVAAVTIDAAATAAIIFLRTDGFPRSIILMAWLMNIGALGGIRLALRVWREFDLARKRLDGRPQPVLIIGASDAGAMLAREYAKHPEINCAVVGFLDDDPSKQGLHVAGKPVLGTRSDLERVAKEHGAAELVIAMPSVKGKVLRDTVEQARKLGLKIKTVPGIYELVNGTVSVSQVRDVQIEDLLGRDEVKMDLEAVAAYLTGEVVLVTGAGGSIGSELCRQVCRFGPKQLLLLGHGENSIYEIDLELRGKYPELDLRPVIADIQDAVRIRQVFEQYRPGVVFHAAAHKHVPLMEHNPGEAVKNNIFGTLNVARAADELGAKRFVLISSDKAVNPTSVMGATKRAAELIVQSFASRSDTIFVAVRFGNVLGSRGSVIPLFKRQIAAGGPVTVTDPRMVRYFMTIPEAVQLVIQAASMGHGGEVFVLDMGEPVKIVDLARDLIRLSGFEPDVDIPIAYSGIRPGEKLYEELLTAEEGTQATRHERIFVARPDTVSQQTLDQFLEAVSETACTGRIGNHELRAEIDALLGRQAANRPLSLVGALRQ